MEDKFGKLHELCRRNELIQQKLWGIAITLFGIGLQAFSGEVLFILFTFGFITIGMILFAKDTLISEEV